MTPKSQEITALASQWSVAGDVTKESYSTASWRCLPDERRWAATSQNILSSINSCSSGLRSKEVKVRIHLSCLCFFSMKPRWNEFVTQLFDCERCLHSITFQLTRGNQHLCLVGILRSQNNAVKTKFTFGSLEFIIYFPQWIKYYCLCRFRYRRERINVTSESERNSKWSKASLGWYQNWKRRHSAELWLNACPMTWKIRSAVSPLRDSSQTAKCSIHWRKSSTWMRPRCGSSYLHREPLSQRPNSVYTFARLIRE